MAGAFLLLAAAPPPLRPPSDDVLREATALVEAMKTSERGPYRRIAWFCNDGTVQPPVPYACRDRGGGRQHAEYSTDRERLAELGFPVGTIFAALPWTEVWEPERRHLRLRQLVLERYLVAADDGWVLRQARWYRGRVQIEDEESAGRDLLIQLLARTDWVRSDFLLAREATRAIPHHGGEDRTRLLRRLAEDIARIDSAFQPLRIKIHTSPEPKDAASVRDWTSAARKRGVADDVVAQADSLITVIESLYSDQGRAERLAQYRRRLARSKSDRELATRLAALEGAPLAARLPQLAGLLRDLRRTVEASTDGERNVRLLDLSLELESLLVADAFTRLSAESASRSDLAELARVLADGTYGVGLLSEGERDEVTTALAALPPDGSTSSEAWLEAARVLRRTGTWSLGAVRWTFAEPLAQWGALEPKATRFPDDLLRSSPALALGEVTRAFVADAESVAGTPHRVFETAAPNLVGLNPGVAVGRLRVADPDEVGNVARDEIVVLRRTVSELSPVAGILTLSEGNLLSHIQILARNLGIPNALLSRDAGARVTAADGDSVLLAVSSAGSVVLERWADVPDSLRNALTRR
ncbi:MAG: hypothetical protein KC591_10765, partial [Gemmatimonadetes bacterium]|nr:hypothetical protein [Gemmatimonadota bacterium]